MSRIGKNPVQIPDGVEVTLSNLEFIAKGPKGTFSMQFHKDMKVEKKENEILVSRPTDEKIHRALHGTTRQLVANAIQGVLTGYKKELEIRGIGYQANMHGNRLILALGYSHDIYFDLPDGIEVKAERNFITVSGVSKQLVGEVAAKIRSFRKPEPYKGKGIRYKDEYVRHKQGKTVGA